MADERVWWQDGVHYQIYPRSFADSDGDGVGDLRGIIDHLDHLAWLGVDGVWLSPIMVSPNADWGYDVADYTAVQPEYGTLADVDELIAEADRRGLEIILDLVPNHTSDQHAWFRESRSSRDNPKRDWYVWADPKPDGSRPNNWTSTFGGPAWTLDDATGQFYLHNFTPQQPDLNWWNDDVRDEFDRILRFWFDRGVAGFRIDVAHVIVKDRELRDNPPNTDDDHFMYQVLGQRPLYTQCLPEVHDVHRRWRKLADSYDPPRMLVGETYVFDVPTVASFYGNGDELHLAFNIPLLHTPFEAGALRAVVEQTEAEIPPGCWPVWTAGNHDLSRYPTRWADGDPAKARCALMMTLTLRGTAFLYYGDELGLPDTDVPKERLRDPVGLRFHPVAGRDPERTPMPWSAEPGGAFTTDPGVEPWLPYGDFAACNVADQRRDPDSMLSLGRDLIGLRDAVPDLRCGAYVTLASTPEGLWAWRRGEQVVVALNLGDEPATLDGVTGLLRIGTARVRDGERVDGVLRLDPWEGAVVWVDR
jgi:alpha-glucosidase